MSYKKFQPGDILVNTIKTKPKYKFKFYNGNTYFNNGTESNIYLQKLNEEIVVIPPSGCLFNNAYDFSCADNSQYIATI